MADIAYAPKAGREDPDHFGAVFVNDFKSIDVRQALAHGVDDDHQDGLLASPPGYVITDDPDVQRVLDAVDSLKHVTLEEAREVRKTSEPKTEKRPASTDTEKEA